MRFNIRVYGIWVQNNQLLVSEEKIGNKRIVKFPGGGLEWGEGTIDCLKREWQEELNMAIEVGEHFYTTDFFQPSAFDASQVISIYYRVSVPEANGMTFPETDDQRFFWVAVAEITEQTFPLPIDRKVGSLLKQFAENRKA